MNSTLILGAKPSDLPDEQVPEPHLFLLIEGSRPEVMSMRYRLHAIDEVVLGRGEVRHAQRHTEAGRRQLVIRIPDPWMSSTHARIVRHGSSFRFVDAGSTNGSICNGQTVHTSDLADGDTLELGQTFFLFRSSLEARKSDPEIADALGSKTPPGFTSLLPSLAHRFELLTRIVKSPVPIVLIGPSGTGKEVVAKTIHKLSERGGSFVAVNCGALPKNLVESELFGYKKGAFSGAVKDHPGLILSADGGTLLLDEIGDLPPASQAALLRVLQEREVLPVGGTRPIPVDFRLLCATHRDMESLVAEGTFREDLYARLSGFRLQLPPLAERIEDIGILIAALLRELRETEGQRMSLSNEALRLLIGHPWPRNIRQLRAVLNTALALAGDETLEPEHFPELLEPPRPSSGRTGPADEPRESNTLGLSDEQKARRQQLDALLREHKGNISAVGRAMGKARPQIQRWIRRYQLDPDSYRD